MNNHEVAKFLKAALECSVYLAPLEPGLSTEEIYEAAERVGFQSGEIGDALDAVASSYYGQPRLLPSENDSAFWGTRVIREEPELRNFDAFDFVILTLGERVRADGAGRAQLERSVIVERAIGKGIKRIHIEAAITVQLMSGRLKEHEGVIRFAQNSDGQGLPSALHHTNIPVRRNESRARALPIVNDIVARRSDGRKQNAEPLDAFSDELGKLGFGNFRLWWVQTVAELRKGDAHSAPVSVSILAAALVEGALIFLVKHARTRQLGVFASKDFEGSPQTWRLEALVNSSATGRESAILDAASKIRVDELIRIRRRIHAGRLLSDFPAGVPDLLPEEARAARATAELVVRKALDWLERYPVGEAT